MYIYTYTEREREIPYSNKSLDVEISSSNKPPHNDINNLKGVE
jgi:hypothetical protein